MQKDHIQIGKFLSYVLRHKPEAIQLELDPEGWADIEDLLKKADIPLDHDSLIEVVANNDKQRFSISDDGKLIRANQGHSLNVDLALQPIEPPTHLYHGTATRFVDRIMQEGILPQSRQYVHLSADSETAIKVGQRHGKPVVLMVDAHSLHERKISFFQAKNGVWLTKFVPPEAISIVNY